MSSVYRIICLATLASLACKAAELRVCADPDNLPFSDFHRNGFENQLASLVAGDLGLTLRYVWLPQRGRFLKALREDACDLEMGLPTGSGIANTTQPYYRSSYVFVTRRNGGSSIHSFDDPAIRGARVGIQTLATDDATVPPAHAMAARGLYSNIVWYRRYDSLASAESPGTIVDAVARGAVDLAVVWGPLAGYLARRAPAALRLTPVTPSRDAGNQFAFDISMGVRPNDARLLSRLNSVIRVRREAIGRILAAYGVPLVQPDTRRRERLDR